MGYKKTSFRQGPELPPPPPPTYFSKFARLTLHPWHKLSFTLCSLVAGVAIYSREYLDGENYFDSDRHEKALTYKSVNRPYPGTLPKKVLVLPFHRMKLVETRKNKVKSLLIDSEVWERSDAPFEVRSVVKQQRAHANHPTSVYFSG
jgi:hypothetical protein